MRISSYAVARPVYYDRAPDTNAGSFSNTLGPHALTVRWTITAAAGRKLYVDTALVVVMRTTAAAVAGIYTATIESPFGNVLTAAYGLSNTVGATTQQSLGGSILILPGATVYGQTVDASTGGTVFYSNYAHAIGFDA